MVNIAGKKVSGWWLVGGAAGVGVVFYIYKKSAGSSTTSSASTSGIDPLTGLPYAQDSAVDPATGLTYLQEAQQYGSVGAAEAAVAGTYSSYGGGSSGILDSGYPAYGYGGTGTTTQVGTYATNAQWAQAATAGLVALGYSSQDVSAALGLYFQSMPLTSGADGVSYLQIVQSAVAEFGPPPVGTFAIIGPPSSGGTGTGTGGGGTGNANVAVPNVVGIRWDAAKAAISAVGLKPTQDGAKTGFENWVETQSPAAGTTVAEGSTVHCTCDQTRPAGATGAGSNGDNGVTPQLAGNTMGPLGENTVALAPGTVNSAQTSAIQSAQISQQQQEEKAAQKAATPPPPRIATPVKK